MGYGKTVQVQINLLQNLQNGEELDTSCSRRCSDASKFLYRNDDGGEDEIAVEVRSSSRTGKPAVWHTFAKYSAHMLALLQSDVLGVMLRLVLGYKPKRDNGTYVQETII